MENLPVSIDKLQEFILVGRAKLSAYRVKLNLIDKLPTANAIRKQTLQDAQDGGSALLYAESKLGELLFDLPSPKGSKIGKRGLEKSLPTGITHKQSFEAQELYRNRGLIEGVIEEAREKGRIPSRDSLLNVIKCNKKEERKRSEKEERKKEISDIEIRKGDFKKVLADLKDIDAIITDPPYPKEYIQCFSDLSKYASLHLKKDGFIAVYSGQYNLPEVINRLSEHLTYVWTFCLSHEGSTQLVNGVNIMCGWKPVLIFSNGKKKMRYTAYDVLISETREKHSHEWQQSESGVKPLIELFAKPGELVVDPFAGSGTFLKVAKSLGCRAIGAEIEPV